MKLGSLFSGIGGFDLAAERCGVGLAWQCEIEPFPRKVLAKRFPGVRIHPDVRKVTADVGAIDLLAGGFPCQDLSVAGKRAGLAGERSGLFWEIVRLADALHPRWLLLENVPGLLSSNERRDMGAVLRALGNSGYGFAYRVLDAQFFGVPQRRRRVLIVGCLGDARRAAEVLFESEGCAGNPAPSRQAGTRAAYSLAASVRGTGDGHGNAWNTDYVYNPYRTLERDGSVSEGFKPDGITDALHGPTGNKAPLVDATLNSGGNSGGFRTEPGEHLVTGPLTPGAHPGGFNGQDAYSGQLFVTRALSAEGHDASERGTPLIAFQCQGSNVGEMGTLRSGNAGLTGGVPMLASPLTASSAKTADTAGSHGSGPKNLIPLMGVRRLMPVECEALQGFPRGWTCLHDHPQQCDCPDSPRYRALGNAVCVNVAEWVLRRLAVLESEQQREAVAYTWLPLERAV